MYKTPKIWIANTPKIESKTILKKSVLTFNNVQKHENIYEKYQVISGLDKEEIVKMQGVLMNIGEKVELVC